MLSTQKPTPGPPAQNARQQEKAPEALFSRRRTGQRGGIPGRSFRAGSRPLSAIGTDGGSLRILPVSAARTHTRRGARTARCGRGEARTAPRCPPRLRHTAVRAPAAAPERSGETHASTEPSQRKETRARGARRAAPHGPVLQGHGEVTARDGESGASRAAPRPPAAPPAGTEPAPRRFRKPAAGRGGQRRAGQQPAPGRAAERPRGTARPAPPPPPQGARGRGRKAAAARGRAARERRYSRGAAVAVLVGDGLDAAAPRNADVAVQEAEVDADHRHDCAGCSPPACDRCAAGTGRRRLFPTAEHQPPTGGCSPLRRRAVPAGGQSAGRRLRLRQFPEGLGPRGRRAPRIPERSGNGGRRCHQSAAPRRASVLRRGPARPLKGAARSPSLPQRHSSVLPSGGFAFSERRGARPAYPRYRYVGSYGYRFRHKHQDHTTHSTVTAV